MTKHQVALGVNTRPRRILDYATPPRDSLSSSPLQIAT
jgi:hypothetical protein